MSTEETLSRVMARLSRQQELTSRLPCIFGTDNPGRCDAAFEEGCDFRSSPDCPRRRAEKAPGEPPDNNIGQFLETAKRDEIPDRLVDFVKIGKYFPTQASSAVAKFMDSPRTILALCGQVGTGKTTAAMQILSATRGQYVRPVDILREGVRLQAIDRARKVSLTLLDGLCREDLGVDYHLTAGVVRWLAEAAYEFRHKMIITVDDHWRDRENPSSDRQPIRGVGTLLGAAMRGRIDADGMVAEVSAL